MDNLLRHTKYNIFEVIPEFNYLDTYLEKQYTGVSWSNDHIHLIGSRKSAKTTSWIITIGKAVLDKKHRVRVWIYRRDSAGLNDTWEEVLQTLDEMGINYSLNATRKIIKIGRNEIRGRSLHTMQDNRIKLKGQPKDNDYEYVYKIIEERTEMKDNDIESINMAIRGGRNIVEINCSNPDSLAKPYIAWCNSNLIFSEGKLSKGIAQFKIVNHETYRDIFHYTNYLMNTLLVESDTAEFEKLKIVSPTRYKVSGLGLPGIESGLIFAEYIDKIGVDSSKYRFNKFTLGLDLGMAQTTTAHPTAMSLWGLDYQERTAVKCGEFHHDNNEDISWDSRRKANEILNQLQKWSYQFPEMRRGCDLLVDYGSGGQVFIDMLNMFKEDYDLDHITIKPVIKSIMYLNDRIDFSTIAMSCKIIMYDWSKCPHTKEQYSLMHWKDETGSKYPGQDPKMADEYDDHWDSDMYALMPYMKGMLSQSGAPIDLMTPKGSIWNA